MIFRALTLALLWSVTFMPVVAIAQSEYVPPNNGMPGRREGAGTR